MEVLSSQQLTKEMFEKVSYFDLVFRTKDLLLSKRNVRVSLHVDMEPQMSYWYRPGCPIEKRGMYYLARQLSLVTKRMDYSQLEKCYSIFICWDDTPILRRTWSGCADGIN